MAEESHLATCDARVAGTDFNVSREAAEKESHREQCRDIDRKFGKAWSVPIGSKRDVDGRRHACGKKTSESQMETLAQHLRSHGGGSQYLEYLRGSAGSEVGLGTEKVIYSREELDRVVETLRANGDLEECSHTGQEKVRATSSKPNKRPRATVPDIQHEVTKRAGVCKRILDALDGKALLAQHSQFSALATAVENELHSQLSPQDYAVKCRSVLFNLKVKDSKFRMQLISGAIQPRSVPSLTSDQMASEKVSSERAQIKQAAMEEVQLDWEMKHCDELVDGLFTCSRCNSKKTTYQQMQVGHGLDEPPTTFVTCFSCGNRWKFDDVGASADVNG